MINKQFKCKGKIANGSPDFKLFRDIQNLDKQFKLEGKI